MSSIADERTSGLARLAVHLGANVAPGRDVVVLAFDIEHAALAREVAVDGLDATGSATPILRDDVWIL